MEDVGGDWEETDGGWERGWRLEVGGVGGLWGAGRWVLRGRMKLFEEGLLGLEHFSPMLALGDCGGVV